VGINDTYGNRFDFGMWLKIRRVEGDKVRCSAWRRDQVEIAGMEVSDGETADDY
jgi:hypothetical protein